MDAPQIVKTHVAEIPVAEFDQPGLARELFAEVTRVAPFGQIVVFAGLRLCRKHQCSGRELDQRKFASAARAPRQP